MVCPQLGAENSHLVGTDDPQGKSFMMGTWFNDPRRASAASAATVPCSNSRTGVSLNGQDGEPHLSSAKTTSVVATEPCFKSRQSGMRKPNAIRLAGDLCPKLPFRASNSSTRRPKPSTQCGQDCTSRPNWPMSDASATHKPLRADTFSHNC